MRINIQNRSFWLLPLSLSLSLALASCSGEAELFSKTSLKLAEKVGAPCGQAGAPAQGDISVEEEPTSCGAGICLGYAQQSYCSCRCDGPTNEAPFCHCPGGFQCKSNLIVDLGFGSTTYVGGYCVQPSLVPTPLPPSTR